MRPRTMIPAGLVFLASFSSSATLDGTAVSSVAAMAFSAFLSCLLSETHLYLPPAYNQIAAMQRDCDQDWQNDASEASFASGERSVARLQRREGLSKDDRSGAGRHFETGARAAPIFDGQRSGQYPGRSFRECVAMDPRAIQAL